MARSKARPQPTEAKTLSCQQTHCPTCGRLMHHAYDNWRKVTLLDGQIVRLQLQVRRCENTACARYHVAYRPEAEGRWALPEHEFGLEIIAQIGAWRYRNHRSFPEIHQALRDRQVDTPALALRASAVPGLVLGPLRTCSPDMTSCWPCR